MKFIMLIGLLSLLSCSLSEKNCQEMNWYEKGYDHGIDLDTTKKFTKYKVQCLKYNIRIDEKALLSGYKTGLTKACYISKAVQDADSRGRNGQHAHADKYTICPNYNSLEKKYMAQYKKSLKYFCTYNNGYKEGSENKELNKNCNIIGDSSFHQGYIAGQKYYTAQHESLVQNGILQYKLRLNAEQRICSRVSDCVVANTCADNKCTNTGKSCTYSSDCQLSGNCSQNICIYN